MRARVRLDEGWNLKFYRSMDKEAVMAACVHEHDLVVRNLRRRMGDFPEITEVCGGAWQGFG